MGDGGFITPEDCSRWIDITLKYYSKRGCGLFLVEAGEPPRHVGSAEVTHPGGQPEPEIKYVIRSESTGRGLAQELVGETCEHVHQEWGRARIIATCTTTTMSPITFCKSADFAA